MTKARFDELEQACKAFCEVRYTGCRQVRDNANKMLKDALLGENTRRKNSYYFVYVRSVNHGTRNYPDIEKALFCEPISAYKETDKSFVGNCERISKDSIIAWLS